MPSPHVVRCVHCESPLKLKDESFLGRKVRCPSCGESFRIPERRAPASSGAKQARKRPARPQPPPEDDFSFDLGDDYGEDFDSAPPPTRKPSGKGKKKKKKKRKSTGPGLGRIGLIAAVILLGLSMLGGLGYGVVYLVQNLPLMGGRFDWMPEEMDSFIEIRVAELWNSPFFEPIREKEEVRKHLQTLPDTQIQFEDIEKIAAGWNQRSQHTTQLVRTHLTRPADESLFPDATVTEYGGYKLYHHGGSPQVSFIPGEKVVVTGHTDAVKKAIDADGKCEAAKEFRFLSGSGEIVVGALGSVRPPQWGPGTRFPMFSPGGGTGSNAERMSLTVNCGRDLTFRFDARLDDADSATRFHKETEDGIAQMRQGMTQLQSMAQSNPLISSEHIRPVVDGLNRAVESITVKQSGSRVSGEGMVPGDLVQAGARLFDTFSASGPPTIPQQTPSGRRGPLTPPGIAPTDGF
jgi:hypothetical protein